MLTNISAAGMLNVDNFYSNWYHYNTCEGDRCCCIVLSGIFLWFFNLFGGEKKE